MAKTFNDFYSYSLNKCFNTLGNISSATSVNWKYPYDGQCVSLIKAYLKYLGYGAIAYGDAIDYWTQRTTSGILNVCDVVTGSPKNGDIGVSAGSDPKYGHVFIYKDGSAYCQNCCNSPYAKVWPLSYQGTVYGYLRPKCLNTTTTVTTTTTTSSSTKWDYNAVLYVGDTVRSSNLSFTRLNSAQDAAWISDLGGWVPLADISEGDAGDGKQDNILRTTASKVYLDPCKVVSISSANIKANEVVIQGAGSGAIYAVKADKLGKKIS